MLPVWIGVALVRCGAELYGRPDRIDGAAVLAADQGRAVLVCERDGSSLCDDDLERNETDE